MAKVKAPFLSLGASGKLADTLVASTWKGLKTMREYVIPTNPQTADQTTQRNLFTAMVSAWRNYFTSTVERSAWNRSALHGPKAMSGFNAFMGAAVQIASGDADASFSNGAVAAAGNIVTFTVLNVDDGAAGDEAGNFEVWAGFQPTSLLVVSTTSTIAASEIDTPDLGDTDDVMYVKIRKGGQDRSGIHKVTLVA